MAWSWMIKIASLSQNGRQGGWIGIWLRGEYEMEAIAIPVEAVELCDGPYEFCLLATIAMVHDDFGEYPIILDDLATLSMMSTGKLSQCLRVLKEKGLVGLSYVIPASLLQPSENGERCSFCEACFPLLQGHHIKFTSNGGSDVPENITYLCPNCHKLAHARVYIPYWRLDNGQVQTNLCPE